ncbi:helicase-associated domain-containing protein [Saxibacter everestensis]|uniref:Helicase-associated domain-containing protein n=1 Tax=Saxibacter everestensis TaxID=2909229 RepID=A0ABY8QUG2_9MICO|nr:helicase-associated domain-containing protein [Brevibacteriaceae bacterium ZFBP1038]
MPKSTSLHTFADWLRSRDETAIRALLQHRADLSVPRPGDISSLAARASTRASVGRIVDQLNTPQLQVLTAAMLLAAEHSPVSASTIRHQFGKASARDVKLVVGQLVERGLLWDPGTDLRVQPVVAEVLAPYPAGLGPRLADLLQPAESTLVCSALGVDDVADAATVLKTSLQQVLKTLPDGAAKIVQSLSSGFPEGRVERRVTMPTSADLGADRPLGAVESLLSRGIALALPPDRIVLSREAGIGARNGRVYQALAATAPEPASQPMDQDALDQLAAGTIFELLRQIDELLTLLDERQLGQLRSGGLGMRDLRRLALDLDRDEPATARLLELAYVAGLIGATEDDEPLWLPTLRAGSWRALPTAAQWRVVTEAWLPSSRWAGLVGTKDQKGVARTALGHQLDRSLIVAARTVVLRQWLPTPPGSVLSPDDVREALHWHYPRSAPGFMELVSACIEDATWLGILAGSVVPGSADLGFTSFGRDIVTQHLGSSGHSRAGVPPRVNTSTGDQGHNRLAELLPEVVHEVLLQADLTAVAPGPLAAEVRETFSSFATVEGRGQGTVFRFGAGSVRNALGQGWETDGILDYLREHSSTPVPQPLEYLIRDAGRTFGRLRIGSARSYLRSDHPELLDELMAHAGSPHLVGIDLLRIAPTVVCSSIEASHLGEGLHQLGMSVVAEADGQMLIHKQEKERPDVVPPAPVRSSSLELPAEVASEIAQQLFAEERRRLSGDPGDADGALRRNGSAPQSGSPLRTRADNRALAEATAPISRDFGSVSSIAEEPTAALALLREAVSESVRVRVGVADSHGNRRNLLLDPLGVNAGRLRARNVDTGQEITIVAHRITDVRLAE